MAMKARAYVKPKFCWRLWQWTRANENLFELTKDEALLFELFVKEARK